MRNKKFSEVNEGEKFTLPNLSIGVPGAIYWTKTKPVEHMGRILNAISNGMGFFVSFDLDEVVILLGENP